MFLLGLPRMRGDRPLGLTKAGKIDKFTPHARGSTFSAFCLTKRN